MFFHIVVLLILIVASVEDFIRKEVSVVIPVLIGINSLICVIASILSGEFNCPDVFVSLLPGVLLLLIGVMTGQEIGYGDGIIALCFAPALGVFDTCLCFAVAMTVSAIVSIIILVLGKGNKKTKLPFVPFITLGVGVTILAQI